MSNEQSAVINALGSLLGYIGAEVVTPSIFERLLWPQRFYNGYPSRLSTLGRIAFLMPMGGPLHKAALTTLDTLLTSGLFRGSGLGHMLGSPFFNDSHLRYTAYEAGSSTAIKEATVRNGLWVRAIENLPVPLEVLNVQLRRDAAAARPRTLHRVSHLSLSAAEGNLCGQDVIGTETGKTCVATFVTIVLTELTALVMGAIVIVIWRTWFAVMWFIPVTLKLFSGCFALLREEISFPSTIEQRSLHGFAERSEKKTTVSTIKIGQAPAKNIIVEVHNLKHGFLVIDGDSELLLQFFRHYGHPIRNRFREVVQIVIVVGFVLIFPAGLVASLLWMPPPVQYVWLGYQLYATVAMHLYRYTGGNIWAGTEEKIVQQWSRSADDQGKHLAYLRTGSVTLKAEVGTTYHDHFQDAKSHVARLLTI